ncbi:MAG: CIA30 family protein [Ignavibacterium sp.]|nr:MAG: CIA30 family protein [Ignavibacterium sp.]
MISIVFLTVMSLIMNSDKVIFNFDSPETSGDWTTVNDVVMGGVSESRFEINSDSTATFSGTVLPDNNGGFASARTYLESEFDGFEGTIIRVKGDGNIYNLRFRTDNNFDGMSYQAKFKTDAREWKEYKIPLSDFKPTFRGRTLSNKPKLESKNMKQIGILIADKQFGRFELNIDWIKLY